MRTVRRAGNSVAAHPPARACEQRRFTPGSATPALLPATMALRALLAVALLLATAPVFAQIPCSSITNEASSGALTCTEGAQPGVQVMGAEHPNHALGYWVDTPGLLDGSWTYLAAGTNAMGDSSTMCGGTGRAGTTRVNHLGHGGPTAAGRKCSTRPPSLPRTSLTDCACARSRLAAGSLI